MIVWVARSQFVFSLFAQTRKSTSSRESHRRLSLFSTSLARVTGKWRKQNKNENRPVRSKRRKNVREWNKKRNLITFKIKLSFRLYEVPLLRPPLFDVTIVRHSWFIFVEKKPSRNKSIKRETEEWAERKNSSFSSNFSLRHFSSSGQIFLFLRFLFQMRHDLSQLELTSRRIRASRGRRHAQSRRNQSKFAQDPKPKQTRYK